MICVSHISKSYKHKKVLEDISFQANCGECVAIVGKNGCGKSTLLQIMAGVLRADHGRLEYFGHEAVKRSNVCSRYCGYVPQENPLLEELSVSDNLNLWGAGKHCNRKEVIRQFQLEDILKIPVGKLSGGMKRRLAIACAILEWPPVLLLDEPTTALDLYHKEVIMEWLKHYRNMNGIVVMTTHEEREIVSADRCLVMTGGHLRELTGEQICMEEIRKYMFDK